MVKPECELPTISYIGFASEPRAKSTRSKNHGTWSDSVHQSGRRLRCPRLLRLGTVSHPGEGALLWGDIPESWKPLYSLNMLPAALGYLTFTAYLLAAKPEELRFRGEGPRLVPDQLRSVLTTAAFWMPSAGSRSMATERLLLQSVLAVTGLASIHSSTCSESGGTTASAFSQGGTRRRLLLALQCAVLNAIVWEGSSTSSDHLRVRSLLRAADCRLSDMSTVGPTADRRLSD